VKILRALSFKAVFGGVQPANESTTEWEQKKGEQGGGGELPEVTSNLEAAEKRGASEENGTSEDDEEARLDFMLQIPTHEAVVNNYFSAMTSHGSYFSMDDMVHCFHARLDEHAKRRSDSMVEIWRGATHDVAPPSPQTQSGNCSWWNLPEVGGYPSWQSYEYSHASRFRWTFAVAEWCYIASGKLIVVPDEMLAPTVVISAGDLAYIPQGLQCTVVVVEPALKKVRYSTVLPPPPLRRR